MNSALKKVWKFDQKLIDELDERHYTGIVAAIGFIVVALTLLFMS